MIRKGKNWRAVIRRALEINRILRHHGLRRYAFGAKIRDTRDVALRLREAFEDMGSVYIKLGQFLSVNNVDVPFEFRSEFERLRDEVPVGFPLQKAITIVERELKKDFKDIFRNVSDSPLAIGSLAQVYRATLLDGTKVALKVQNPHAEETVKKDMFLLFAIGRFLKRSFKRHNFDIMRTMEELEGFIEEEVDFEQEAVNADILKSYELPKYEYIPKIYFHSRRVLVEEFVEGIKISDTIELQKRGAKVHDIIDNLLKSMMYHIFRDGIFHGDPHPANILVLKDDRVALIDTGTLGRLTDKMRKSFVKQYEAILTNDPAKYLDTHLDYNEYDMKKGRKYNRIKDELKVLFDEYTEKKNAYAIEYSAKANLVFFQHNIPPQKKILLLTRAFLALTNIAKNAGVCEQRYEFLIKVLAHADAMPYADRLKDEIMEIDPKRETISETIFDFIRQLAGNRLATRYYEKDFVGGIMRGVIRDHLEEKRKEEAKD